MIYQPRNVQPSSTSIDITRDNVFSMEVQTNTYITAYQLTVVDFENNVKYTGSRTSVEKPIYNGGKLSIPVEANIKGLQNGTNYKWNVKLYQRNQDMMITYGFFQPGTKQAHDAETIIIQPNINVRKGMMIKTDGEYRTIKYYDSKLGLITFNEPLSKFPRVGQKYFIYSDFIETTPDYVFYARELPTVSILDAPNRITLKYHTFQGSYEQTENVPIVYHIFDLYEKNSDGSYNLIDTSGKVYSADLSYYYNAFRTGNSYAIKMTVENDMGIISETNLYEFVVQYNIIEYLQQPVATFENKSNSVKISWVTPVEHEAIAKTPTGEISDIGFNYLYNTPYSPVNSLYTKGYVAEWQSNDGLYVIPEDFNITMQFSPDENFFYGRYGYMPVQSIIEGESEKTQGEGNFKICLDTYNLVFAMPHIVEDKMVTVNVVNAPSGDENTKNHFYIDGELDIENNPYITFVDENYIEKVLYFDPETNMVIMQRELPFTPKIGEKIMITDTLYKPLYDTRREVFVLTQTGVTQINEDYIWDDDATWNDDFIWTEGGTSIERVCNHWWKIQITNNSIKVEEIYPSAS